MQLFASAKRNPESDKALYIRTIDLLCPAHHIVRFDVRPFAHCQEQGQEGE